MVQIAYINLRVPSGPDEVETSVNPEVNLFVALRLLLLAHIRFVLVINEVDDWRPGITVVDIVTKSGGVNDGKFDLELLFLKLSLDYFDFCELVELFVVPPAVVPSGRQLGSEKCVH
jgi:hypothetical protein